MTHTSEVIERFHHWLSSGAIFKITVDRNEKDEYYVQTHPESGTLGFTRQDIYSLIPTGSRWSQLLGWHSYVGIPFPLDVPRSLVIGVETVAPHATRGATVVFHAYVFSFPCPPQLLENLYKLADAIDPTHLGDEKLKISNGLIRTTSMNVSDHAWVEGAIIRRSVEYYRRSSPLLFRTIVLLEDQLAFNIKHTKLFVTVQPIEDDFSEAIQKKLNRYQKHISSP